MYLATHRPLREPAANPEWASIVAMAAARVDEIFFNKRRVTSASVKSETASLEQSESSHRLPDSAVSGRCSAQ
jgi:hypothetical protein